MDLMIIEAASKERINRYLMEAEADRMLRAAGISNWWEQAAAFIWALLSTRLHLRHQKSDRCCATELSVACC